MKKSILTLAVFLVVNMGVIVSHEKGGKDRKSPEEVAKIMSDKMKQELSLTDEQYEKVYKVNLEIANKKQETKENKKSFLEEKEQELKEILNEEQRAKFDAKKDVAKKKFKEKSKKWFKNN